MTVRSSGDSYSSTARATSRVLGSDGKVIAAHESLVAQFGDFGLHWQAAPAATVASMSTRAQPVSVLSETECWSLLSSVALGRLVTSVGGHPEIFPVNFAVQHRTVLFRTAEGTKLVSSAINEQVLFEVDQHDVTDGWSVIVKGTARVVRTDEDVAEAEQAELVAWTAPAKQHFVRIRPLSVTGRRFAFETPVIRDIRP
jgi:uncharacterized protein